MRFARVHFTEGAPPAAGVAAPASAPAAPPAAAPSPAPAGGSGSGSGSGDPAVAPAPSGVPSDPISAQVHNSLFGGAPIAPRPGHTPGAAAPPPAALAQPPTPPAAPDPAAVPPAPAPPAAPPAASAEADRIAALERQLSEYQAYDPVIRDLRAAGYTNAEAIQVRLTQQAEQKQIGDRLTAAQNDLAGRVESGELTVEQATTLWKREQELVKREVAATRAETAQAADLTQRQLQAASATHPELMLGRSADGAQPGPGEQIVRALHVAGFGEIPQLAAYVANLVTTAQQQAVAAHVARTGGGAAPIPAALALPGAVPALPAAPVAPPVLDAGGGVPPPSDGDRPSRHSDWMSLLGIKV